MSNARQSPYVVTRFRHYLVKNYDFTGIQPSNDAHQRVFQPKQRGRKLLAITVMVLVMVYLVWSMG